MESIVKLRKKIDLELSAISNMQQMSSWLLRKKKMATPFQHCNNLVIQILECFRLLLTNGREFTQNNCWTQKTGLWERLGQLDKLCMSKYFHNSNECGIQHCMLMGLVEVEGSSNPLQSCSL